MSGDFQESGAPRVRFGRRERRGALLGLTRVQLAVISCATAISLFWMIGSWNSFWTIGFVPLSVAALAGGWSWHREPLVSIAGRAAIFALRRARGITHYERDVWRTTKESLMKPGKPQPGASAPKVIGSFELPGPLAAIQIVQCDDAGAFTVDRKNETASFTIEIASQAWQLRDTGTQESAYDGFVDWLKTLGTISGLRQADARIRVDTTPATELSEYVDAKDRHATEDAALKRTRLMGAIASAIVSPTLRTEYAALIAHGAARSMSFTNQVTITISISELREQIRNGGGGLTGLGTLIAELIPGLQTSLQQAGLELVGWLNESQLRAAIKRAADPVSFTAWHADALHSRRAAHQHPPIMAFRESADSVEIDRSVHQVFCIAEWPRSDVRTGFLEPLLYAGDATRVLALQLRVVRDDKALASVARAKSDMRVAMSIRTRRGMSVNREQERELEELEERENDLVDGFSDVEFRGFVAVTASSHEDLRRASAAIVQAAQPARINLALMYWQQPAAFFAAALPLNARN